MSSDAALCGKTSSYLCRVRYITDLTRSAVWGLNSVPIGIHTHKYAMINKLITGSKL